MFGFAPLPRNLDAALRDAAHARSHVRISAIADLVRWAGTEARPSCIESLSSLLKHDPNDDVRAAAAVGLADAEAVEATDALVEVAGTSPPRIRQMSVLALGEVAPRSHERARAVVRSLLEHDAPALRFQALVAANRIFTARELVEPLCSALRADEARLRYVACRIVEERFLSADREPDAGSLPPEPLHVERLRGQLERCLDDDDDDVALAAALALARQGSRVATRRIAEALNARSRMQNLDDEQAAIELCGELGLARARRGLAVRAWGGLVAGPSPFSFQARVALARLGDSRARRQIVRGLSSWSRRVRTQSAAAAGQARLLDARERLRAMRGDERLADPGVVAEALSRLEDAAEPPSRSPSNGGKDPVRARQP